MNSAIEPAKLAIAHEKAIRVYFPGPAKDIGELASTVMLEEGIRYWIAPGGTSITCTQCRDTSNNENDVVNRYCPKCHLFHEDEAGKETPARVHAAYKRAPESFDWLMASYLIHNRGKMPSTTTLTELMTWSHAQTLEPVAGASNATE